MPAPALAGARQSRRCPAADSCSCSRAGLASRLLLLANRRSRPANALRPGLSAKEGRGTRALLSRETRAPIRSVAGARPRTARPVSQLATRRARVFAVSTPLAESRRGGGSVPRRPVARTRGHGKAGTSDRSATATDADDAARLAAGEIQVRHPAWARDLPLCERSAHRGHSRARWRCLCVTQSRAAHAPRRSLEK